MPAPTLRMYPARPRRMWLGASASAGGLGGGGGGGGGAGGGGAGGGGGGGGGGAGRVVGMRVRDQRWTVPREDRAGAVACGAVREFMGRDSRETCPGHRRPSGRPRRQPGRTKTARRGCRRAALQRCCQTTAAQAAMV